MKTSGSTTHKRQRFEIDDVQVVIDQIRSQLKRKYGDNPVVKDTLGNINQIFGEHCNIQILGGLTTGKTTLLNAFLRDISLPPCAFEELSFFSSDHFYVIGDNTYGEEIIDSPKYDYEEVKALTKNLDISTLSVFGPLALAEECSLPIVITERAINPTDFPFIDIKTIGYDLNLYCMSVMNLGRELEVEKEDVEDINKEMQILFVLTKMDVISPRRDLPVPEIVNNIENHFSTSLKGFRGVFPVSAAVCVKDENGDFDIKEGFEFKSNKYEDLHLEKYTKPFEANSQTLFTSHTGEEKWSEVEIHSGFPSLYTYVKDYLINNVWAKRAKTVVEILINVLNYLRLTQTLNSSSHKIDSDEINNLLKCAEDLHKTYFETN